jgi:hypothetical protein
MVRKKYRIKHSKKPSSKETREFYIKDTPRKRRVNDRAVSAIKRKLGSFKPKSM